MLQPQKRSSVEKRQHRQQQQQQPTKKETRQQTPRRNISFITINQIWFLSWSCGFYSRESDTIFNILLVRSFSFPYLFTNHLWFSGCFCVSFNLGVVFAITKYYPDENLILFNTVFSLQFSVFAQTHQITRGYWGPSVWIIWKIANKT